MNYLLSAYSINPYKGSEDYIGWSWLLQLNNKISKEDKIFVITKRYNEKDLKKGIEEHGIKNTYIIIIDVPKYLDWFREKHSCFHHMYYILWQHYAYKWVKKIKINFDVIHHVTMNDFRITGEMCKLKKSYTIFGPVGGGQITPKSLRYYEDNKGFEFVRRVINKLCSINYFYKKRLKSFDKVYTINLETKKIIDNIINRKSILLPELALKDSFKNLNISHKNVKLSKTFNVIFVGRLIAKKGVILLIDIFKILQKDSNIHLSIYGEGPKFSEIKKLIAQNNLENTIELKGKRNFSEINEAYKQADLLIMPSLRETSGNVLIEALSHRVPIICLDMSFASQLKEENCGVFIDTTNTRENIIADFANNIILLKKNPKLKQLLGDNGYNYVNKTLTWENKYELIYDSRVINKKKKNN